MENQIVCYFEHTGELLVVNEDFAESRYEDNLSTSNIPLSTSFQEQGTSRESLKKEGSNASLFARSGIIITC